MTSRLSRRTHWLASLIKARALGFVSKRDRSLIVLAPVLVGLPIAAKAQDAPEKMDLSLTASIQSDDRFRGYSRSDGHPVAQAQLDGSTFVAADLDIFAGASASSLGNSRYYGAAETDIYAGLDRTIGAFNTTLGVRGYIFPDAGARNYYELFGSARTTYGPATAKLGFAFAPEQRGLRRRGDSYVYSDIDAGIPRTPFTATAHLGWEDTDGFHGKTDWSVGVDYIRSPFAVGIAYVDTNRSDRIDNTGAARRLSRAKLVLSARASF